MRWFKMSSDGYIHSGVKGGSLCGASSNLNGFLEHLEMTKRATSGRFKSENRFSDS